MADQELERDYRKPDEGSEREDGDRQPDSDNLDNNPNFRKYKASQERQIQELRRERDEQLRLLQRYQQENFSLRTQGMDDLERAQFERDQLREQLEYVFREQQARQHYEARQKDINEIIAQTGAPESMFEDVNISLHDAWKLALQWQQQNGRKPQGEDQDEYERYRTAANATTLGGSSQSGGDGGTLQRAYEKALEEGDGMTALDIMYEADKKGVTLKPPK